MGSLVLEHAIKVRKPYTITKERERWTEEEHSKFLEALKLYGRAWRQIEEHIGSKTAVQIRSHAQKFFTKAVRESKSIEIPPPRPKKRPMHPYPRKLGKKFPVSEQDNESPSSVLSSTSDRTNGRTSPASSVAGSDPVGSLPCEQENDNGSVEAPLASLKLFGKTVVVADGQKPPCFDTEDAEPAITINEVISEGGSIQWNQWASSAASMFYLLPSSHGNLLPWFWAFSGEHQSSVRNCSDDGSVQKESSAADSNSINGTGDHGLNDRGEVLVELRRSETSAFRRVKATPRKGTKGFVPYKRCVSERGGENQKAIDEV